DIVVMRIMCLGVCEMYFEEVWLVDSTACLKYLS
ncbi:hypothetical protein AAAA53_04555, partial [Escherichia coli]